MGENHHIGFTVSSRFSWGMRGSYFPVVLRVFVACIWFGLQAYWGGQATRVLWGAIIPGRYPSLRHEASPDTLSRFCTHEKLLLGELSSVDKRFHRIDYLDVCFHPVGFGST